MKQTKNKLNKIINLLASLESVVPENEGAISYRVYSDGSGVLDLEMWGSLVASGRLGEEMSVNSKFIITSNPDWLPDILSMVKRMNSILADYDYSELLK